MKELSSDQRHAVDTMIREAARAAAIAAVDEYKVLHRPGPTASPQPPQPGPSGTRMPGTAGQRPANAYPYWNPPVAQPVIQIAQNYAPLSSSAFPTLQWGYNPPEPAEPPASFCIRCRKLAYGLGKCSSCGGELV